MNVVCQVLLLFRIKFFDYVRCALTSIPEEAKDFGSVLSSPCECE